MKKVFDQTVRDLKREVNKKVLKVPGIEQKVLDATSNEPWGPHGTLLADIAQATRNYHEYQMIMAIIWKRINDTGKNWRHVYKGLTVLEYLVAHGSERVIDDIREHAYQISTLSDFQYIDSSGKDQGSNVRRKSQSLVVLVNDKERIIEVRQKAAANRDKFRNTSAGGMYRPGGYGDRYDDERYEGRYGSRDEDRNGYGYGRDREYNYKDDDRYGRYRDDDRYGNEERYSRDGYRDDDYQGRSRSMDGYGSRSRSSDMDRDRAFDDDGQSSSRGSGARADDQAQDGSIAKRLERKFSEQNLGAPPSYEEATSESRSPAYSERNGETLAAAAPGSSSPPAPTGSSPPVPKASSPPAPKAASPTASSNMSPSASQEVEIADEFDPRGPMSAVPTTSPAASVVTTTTNNAEMDLLGSLSDVFAPNPLAIMPVTSTTTNSEADAQSNFSGSSFVAAQPVSNVTSQPFEDPFGDSPFKAFPSNDAISPQPQSFQPSMNQNAEAAHGVAPNADPGNNFSFGDSFSAVTYSAPNPQPPLSNSQFLPQELSTSNEETDILADILPPTGPPAATLPAGYSAPTTQPVHPGANPYGNFNPQLGSVATPPNMIPQASQFGGGNFLPQGGSAGPFPSNIAPQIPVSSVSQLNNGNSFPQGSAAGSAPQFNNGNFLPQQGTTTPFVTQAAYQTPSGPAAQHNGDGLGNLYSQGSNVSMAPQSSLPSSAGPLAIVPQPSKEKFETKSTVWADTLSRGLVNLNISGPKTNPLADIGVDFDAINRKERRMEKPTTRTVTSTVTMGKAMGSGSGMGRAGASVLRAPSNTMMGSGMGIGMGMGMGGAPGSGMGMGGYGAMNQPMGMAMGGGVGMGMNMGMNMGMGQGGPMQTPGGLPPVSTMPGGYNPMMGAGGYNPQQPYGGYR